MVSIIVTALILVGNLLGVYIWWGEFSIWGVVNAFCSGMMLMLLLEETQDFYLRKRYGRS